jgi:hypothetical protein
MLGTASSLGVGTTTYYFAPNTRAPVTTLYVNAQSPTPGTISIYAMSCGLTAAPGVGSSRTFTVAKNSGPVDTAVTCTISDTMTSCTYQGSAETISDGSTFVMKAAASGTPAGATVSCVLYYTVTGL